MAIILEEGTERRDAEAQRSASRRRWRRSLAIDIPGAAALLAIAIVFGAGKPAGTDGGPFFALAVVMAAFGAVVLLMLYGEGRAAAESARNYYRQRSEMDGLLSRMDARRGRDERFEAESEGSA